MSSRFISDLFSFLIETLVTGIGRMLLREPFDDDPPEIVCLVIGLVFWALLAFLVFAVARGW
ncbi:hypothetical protein RAD16_03760 [Bradyrhizobium sp. 18BD]